MDLREINIGFAMTGSFCTFEKVFRELEKVMETGARVFPLFSDSTQQIESRFGKPAEYLERIQNITGRKPMRSISEAEQIGPKGLFDIMVICPCTGNTVAKLANGITDTPALMGAKAHLRNNRPLVLSISSNDALGMNMKNIGLLLNTKNIYFVPFGQDNPIKKENSLVAHANLLIPTLEYALDGKQYQPVVKDYESVKEV